MKTTNQDNLKSNIEKVILESYKKTKDKNFSDLNFVFPKNSSVIAFLKKKIKIVHSLDQYSQTFLSIHTRAKITLREFQNSAFEGNHLELLRQVLTLPESLLNNKLKSIKIEQKSEDESKVVLIQNAQPKTIHKNIELKNGTKLIKENITGKKITKQKEKQEFDFEEIMSIDFEDEEFNNNIDNLDDIQL